ncbi:MAG: hypothetical protein CMI55_03130 [Parcubacteria group bacterium]|jgi:hypothetical protein|nr:hypothetical protein [Parcubacteria group bacterium]|tara:strand:- start:2935 stop:4812 length:1878 start_codon:yes stop_codon:yes gene_type:complete
MKLKKLKEKLYKPETEFEERLEKPEVFQPERKRKKVLSEEWSGSKKRRFRLLTVREKKTLKSIGFIAGVIFLIIIVIFTWRGFTSFDKDKVRLEIAWPERVVSGEEIKYIVKYKNNTRLALNNLQLVFHYPEGSIPFDDNDLVQAMDLPDIEPDQENQVELSARIIGLKGEEKEAWLELSYQPGNLSSRYTNQAEFSSNIISVPLLLDFDLPEKLVDGQSFDFSLKYLNQAEVSFDDLEIRIDYPTGFNLQSSESSLSERDGAWSIDSLMAGQEDKIFIRGNIEGERGEVKLFKAQIGLVDDDQFIPYAETVKALQISLSPLSVVQTVNESTDYIAETGQQLDYQINFENTTDIGIKNVVITSKLEGAVLDFASLESESGSFDGLTQTITWKASNLPALEFLGARQKGQLNFSIKIKDLLPISNYSDKNFKIINTVKIDSSEIPLSLERIQIGGQSQSITKLASQLTLQAQGYYNDDTFLNSGAIPPKVGQTTTYTIKWRLVNTANDLSKVRVVAFLPPHVKWLNQISPSSGNLKYNFQTGQLIWQVGDLSSATGVLLPVKQIAFQISITPSLADLGNLVELIGQSKVTGLDNFVDLELIDTDEPIDTDLPDDPAIISEDSIIVD